MHDSLHLEHVAYIYTHLKAKLEELIVDEYVHDEGDEEDKGQVGELTRQEHVAVASVSSAPHLSREVLAGEREVFAKIIILCILFLT